MMAPGRRALVAHVELLLLMKFFYWSNYIFLYVRDMLIISGCVKASSDSLNKGINTEGKVNVTT